MLDYAIVTFFFFLSCSLAVRIHFFKVMTLGRITFLL